ncbi:helix-turn-helix transcriptional regulator [Clostridium hydrogeniformans]|uniref:helix-turn-helix transcriptional regulator n=1 Tax=Clostridium hydrogeniformans TaxID=349933 RepID=UPI000A07918C|nr:helix-turn-helix transcriptional regulator [Clostridium hydrogeniformans]
MSVVCRVKEILKETGITQKELASSSGLSKQTISNIVNNRYSTPLESAFKISRF